MSEMIECEIFLACNEEGSWIVSNDESDALELLQSEEGGYHCRVVKVTVKMSPPKMDEATVTVPDTAGEVTATA